MPKINILAPKISIVMPTYNRENFIKEAVLSVLGQNYQNFELIIVDDGSTDKTKKIIKSIKDQRIIYIYQKNLGRSVARNKAIKIARGKYLAFLDSDDLFLPGKLKKQVEFLEKNTEYGMVYTSALNIDEKGKILDYVYEASKSGDIYKDVAFFLPVIITLPTVMVRKDIVIKLRGFDEKMERFEDIDMWRRIAQKYPIYAIPEPLSKIRSHSGNIMGHPLKIFKELNYYILKVFWQDKEMSWSYKRKAASLLCCYYYLAVKKDKNWQKYSFLFYFLLVSYSFRPISYILAYSFSYTYKLFVFLIPQKGHRKRIKIFFEKIFKKLSLSQKK